MLKNKDDCYCSNEIPFQSLTLINSDEEDQYCDLPCSGLKNSICGGAEAFSIYISSKGFLQEQRQNKNDTIWSISKLFLKLPPFFTARIGELKSAANSKLICLSTK